LADYSETVQSDEILHQTTGTHVNYYSLALNLRVGIVLAGIHYSAIVLLFYSNTRPKDGREVGPQAHTSHLSATSAPLSSAPW